MPLAKVFPPVVVFRSRTATLATFGGKNAPLRSALAYAADHDATIAHLVLPPSSIEHPGFQKIEQDPHQHKLHVDGVVVRPGQTFGMYSRDCPIGFLMDGRRNEGVLVHCGRPAMTPRKHAGAEHYTVITSALNALTQRGSNLADLSVVITAGICQDCFVHSVVTDVEMIQPFYDWYPWSVNVDTGGLDLVRVITTQLTEAGVHPEKIKHDGFCTKEHSGLTSKRGGDKDSNLVLVMNH